VIRVIPSPRLFRVESVSFEPDRDYSQFAIFTVGIILTSTSQCLRPSVFLAEGRSPGPHNLVAFLNRFSFQKPMSNNHAIPRISVSRVTGSPTLQYSQNEILVPSRLAFSMTIRLATEPRIVRLPAKVLDIAKASQADWRETAGISLPPLRERRQDIPALVQHFLNRGVRQRSLTPDALSRLCDYHWPGNVRELENTIERALVLAKNGVFTESEIELRPRETSASIPWTELPPLDTGWKPNVEAIEKFLLERALRQAGGNKAKAAELLGIHRRLLYDKMREYGLETPQPVWSAAQG
jgi:hypothetical protein